MGEPEEGNSEATEWRRLERELLACDLHDDVLQEITAALMLLEAFRQKNAGTILPQGEALERAAELLRRCADRLRRVVDHLEQVPPTDADLSPALHAAVATFCQVSGLCVSIDCPDALPAPGTRYTAILVPLVREALFNVWKHAQTSAARVSARCIDGTLRLEIADDGAGFDLAHILAGHFGLESMRRRAHILGGSVDIRSRLGAGTVVAVRVPWVARA